LSASIALSKARIDFSRPTNNGTTIGGYTTTSRSGKRGKTDMLASDFDETIITSVFLKLLDHVFRSIFHLYWDEKSNNN
jgi:hypothetical protein